MAERDDKSQSYGSARGSTFSERIVQRGLQVLSVGAIGWFAVAVTDLKTQTAVTLEKLDAMERRLEDFRTFMGDRYTGADARKDLQPILDELRDHEARLRRLETATH